MCTCMHARSVSLPSLSTLTLVALSTFYVQALALHTHELGQSSHCLLRRRCRSQCEDKLTQRTEELRPQNEERVELGCEPGLCDSQSHQGGAVITPILKTRNEVLEKCRTVPTQLSGRAWLDLEVGLDPRPCSLTRMPSAAPSVGNPHSPVREGELSASRSLAWNGEAPN